MITEKEINEAFDRWFTSKFKSIKSESQGRELMAYHDELKEAFAEGFKAGEEEKAWMRTGNA